MSQVLRCVACGAQTVQKPGMVAFCGCTASGGMPMQPTPRQIVATNASNPFLHPNFGGAVGFDPADLKLPDPPEPTAAPITAWRLWRVSREDGVYLTRTLLERAADDHDAGRNPFRAIMPGARLQSVGIGPHVWEPTEHATCGGGMNVARSATSSMPPLPHAAPDRHCLCGIWALPDREAVEALTSYRGGVHAIGSVLLWGRVFEHAKGFRAEYARPVSLELYGAPEGWAAELRAFYGCEVTVVPEAAQRESRASLGTAARAAQAISQAQAVTQARRKASRAALYGTTGAAGSTTSGGLAQFITTNLTPPDPPPMRRRLLRLLRAALIGAFAGGCLGVGIESLIEWLP